MKLVIVGLKVMHFFLKHQNITSLIEVCILRISQTYLWRDVTLVVPMLVWVDHELC